MISWNRTAAAALTVLLLIFACGRDSSPGLSQFEEAVFFPTYQESGMTPAAIFEGSLMEVNGCLVISGPSFPKDDLALWPTSFRYDPTRSAVVRSNGTVVAVTGDKVSLGGGEENSLADAEAQIGRAIPERCQVGNYWIVSPIPVPS